MFTGEKAQLILFLVLGVFSKLQALPLQLPSRITKYPGYCGAYNRLEQHMYLYQIFNIVAADATLDQYTDLKI